MANRRAIDRVLRLPVVFSVAEASRYMSDLSEKAISVYLARYEKAGYIKKAGPRAGIYYNLLKEPLAPQNRLVDVIKKCYPSALLYGASVLHNAGWTTQIPTDIHLVVLSRPSYPQVSGVTTYPRPRSWYKKNKPNILLAPDFDSYGLPALSPDACLSDMRAYRDGWVPDPEDIEDPSSYTRMAF